MTLFKKREAKRLSRSYNNASGVIAAFDAMKAEAGWKTPFDYTVEERGSDVVLETNIPAAAHARPQMIHVLATPSSLIAVGDFAGFFRIPDVLGVKASDPKGADKIVEDVRNHARLRNFIPMWPS